MEITVTPERTTTRQYMWREIDSVNYVNEDFILFRQESKAVGITGISLKQYIVSGQPGG